MLFIIDFCESILTRRFVVRIDFEVPPKSELDKYKVFTFKSLFVMLIVPPIIDKNDTFSLMFPFKFTTID